MKKYLALLKWALSKTPETALALLAALKIANWKLSLDGVEAEAYSVEYQTVQTLLHLVKERELVVTIRGTFEGQEHVYTAATRFKNNGSDRLSHDGVEQKFVEFDFDIIGLTDTQVRVELRYFDADGLPHELLLSNKAIKVF